MARLIQPIVNPVKFQQLNAMQQAQYVSRHMDNWAYLDTIAPWDSTKPYAQPWQTSDTIRLQFQSDFPIRYKLVDIEERTWQMGNLTPKQQNVDNPGMFIYELSLPLTGCPEGVYFLSLGLGAGENFPLISEPLKVMQHHKHTLLLEYRNTSFYGDAIFETGFAPSIRLRGTLAYKSPSSKDSFFEDQSLNLKLLQSRSFDVWELKVGGAAGIPDYAARILNRILGCDTLLIDGRRYTKAEGSKLEASGQDRYPMRSWSIELRETLNRASIEVQDDAVSLGVTSMIVTVDAKGFGLDDSGGAFQITDIN